MPKFSELPETEQTRIRGIIDAELLRLRERRAKRLRAFLNRPSKPGGICASVTSDQSQVGDTQKVTPEVTEEARQKQIEKKLIAARRRLDRLDQQMAYISIPSHRHADQPEEPDVEGHERP